MEMESWISLYTARKEIVSASVQVTADRAGHVLWQTCGFYQLLPCMPTDCSPISHKYETITCMGHEVSVVGDVQPTGAWQIEPNWDWREARLCHPQKSYLDIPCVSFCC